jgi:hypothetical protein
MPRVAFVAAHEALTQKVNPHLIEDDELAWACYLHPPGLDGGPCSSPRISLQSKTKSTLNVGAIVFPPGHSPDLALQFLLDVSTTVKRAGGL